MQAIDSFAQKIDFDKVASTISKLTGITWKAIKRHDLVLLRTPLRGCNLDVMCCYNESNRVTVVSSAINLNPEIKYLGMVSLYTFMGRSFEGFKTECNNSVERGDEAVGRSIYMRMLRGFLPRFTEVLNEHMDKVQQREQLVNQAEASCRKFARLLNVKPRMIRDKCLQRDYPGHLSAPSLGIEELGFGSSSQTLEVKAMLALPPEKMQQVLELLAKWG